MHVHQEAGRIPDVDGSSRVPPKKAQSAPVMSVLPLCSNVPNSKTDQEAEEDQYVMYNVQPSGGGS
jgi:hypothetical protein